MDQYQALLKELFGLKAVRHEAHAMDQFREVCRALGDPQLAYKVIHVTGTCGKGTVSLQAAKTLVSNGYKTGLVISPHLISFRERISVNFEQIPEEYIVEKYKTITDVFKSLGYNYSFEQVTCLLGFLYLRDQGVEYAVIEVGCGGTRDSSNVVDPVVSVITSVGMDHMQLLGNTIEEIAIEKSGVIKPQRPCIFGCHTPKDLLMRIASEKNSPAVYVEPSGRNFIEENSEITRRIFDFIPVSEEALRLGLSSSQPFRYQKLEVNAKRFILDVGHNEMSLRRVLQDSIREYGANVRVVLATSKGKSHEEFIRVSSEYAAALHLTSCSHSRIVCHEDMLKTASALEVEVQESGDIVELLPKILLLTDDVTVIIGSCFLIEDLIKAFKTINIDLSICA